MTVHVEGFFDRATFTISYVVWDEESRKAAIIDPVLDYDQAAGRTSTASADELIAFIDGKALEIAYILETHVHADHLSAAPYLKGKLGGKTGIGSRVGEVQEAFGDLFAAGPEFARDGSQFDMLLGDGEILPLGGAEFRVLHTPGHTPACVTYLIDSNGGKAFVGDTMFMPDYGSARCDFPGGDAAELYRSIQKILSLPDDTALYMCHDYGGEDRGFEWLTSVAEQKEKNIHLGGGTSESDYVEMRESRDKTLSMPALILPAVQVNMRAGAMPPADPNGVIYLKIPLNKV